MAKPMNWWINELHRRKWVKIRKRENKNFKDDENEEEEEEEQWVNVLNLCGIEHFAGTYGKHIDCWGFSSFPHFQLESNSYDFLSHHMNERRIVLPFYAFSLSLSRQIIFYAMSERNRERDREWERKRKRDRENCTDGQH